MVCCAINQAHLEVITVVFEAIDLHSWRWICECHLLPFCVLPALLVRNLGMFEVGKPGDIYCSAFESAGLDIEGNG